MTKRTSTEELLEAILARGEMSLVQLAALVYHLPSFLKLYWRLYTDPRVPFFWAKLLLGGAIAYTIVPFDFLPDFILPLLGYAEDTLILVYALKKFIHLCPKDIVREHVERISRGE